MFKMKQRLLLRPSTNSLMHPSILTLILALGCPVIFPEEAPSKAPPSNKSWMHIDHSSNSRVLLEGDPWNVPVDYYLDPTEDAGGTLLTAWIGGPWIDCPDGKYAFKRQHVSYPASYQQVKVQSGKGRHVFTFTVPPALEHNSILVLCRFKSPSGKEWPWHVRRSGVWFKRRGGFFELETEKPGNLFLYEDPVRILCRLKNVKNAGQKQTIQYEVWDATGASVAKGEKSFVVEGDGQRVPIDLEPERRGTFLIEAKAEGWEMRRTTFSRIPDVLSVTKGGETAFGMTNVVAPGPKDRLEEKLQIAQRLGFSFCRTMHSWYDLEPGPNVYKLDEWIEPLDMAKRYGIKTWLCVFHPPAWAFPSDTKQFESSYNAVRVNWEAWKDFVRTVSIHFKGRLWGAEWLNEITPGGTENFVDDYLTLCRIGTDTAKDVDPDLNIQLAGGLWPRSFRTAVLAAGAGKYFDILPIHYSNGAAVREAQEDLASYGCHAAVWDNESARGLNTWGVPPREQLMDNQQAQWVLTQWTDELAAGCEKIIYFGGEGDPAGNYSYLLDDLSPRRVAASLAVFASKMSGASPVGIFPLGQSGIVHLFEREGRAIAVCSSQGKDESVDLSVGNASVVLTDDQGNETALAAREGQAHLALRPMPFFLEGADIDVLKAYAVTTFGTFEVAQKRSRLVETPRITLLRGEPGEISVRVNNLYERSLAGSLRVQLPEGWAAHNEASFSLKLGEETVVRIPLDVPMQTKAQDYLASVKVRYAWDKLPEISRPAVLSVLSTEMLGNLLPNGDFETPTEAGDGPSGWSTGGPSQPWAPSQGLGDGLGRKVFKFSHSGNTWHYTSQAIELRGQQTYLYTAWVWNKDMHAGSNRTHRFADGTSRDYHDVQTFTCGQDSPGWQMYTCRVKTEENLVKASFTPVVKGSGWALFDNLRVTLFEGTDFAAECHRAEKSPKVDGNLEDWVKRCPIPLIGKNQLTVEDNHYAWTSQNLNGVGYLMWDEENLYFGLEVRDDVHHAEATGERAIEEDSVILALDPSNRTPATEGKAFAYYLSSAKPGGGSGPLTLYRPAAHSGGQMSGQLFKDSSVYELAIGPNEGRCIYELRIPFALLGPFKPTLGRKIACSIQLNDNDGKGRAAFMTWGGGLSPAWAPGRFGVVTLVE